MKVLIIEDEKITADDLADSIMVVRPQYQILKSTSSIKGTLKFLKTQPDIDLIFSDIQLSDGLSFEIFKKVKVLVPVIFCTAYDEYALNAFETNGIAYLLKPFTKETIEKAIEKFENLSQQKDDKLVRLFEHLEQSKVQTSSPSVLIYQGEKIIPVKLDDVAVMQLENGIVKLHTFDHRKYAASETLEELNSFQHPDFFRVNRQHLVHRKAIKNASKYFNRKLVLNLKFPFQGEIIISKEKATPFLDWLLQS